MPVPSLAFVPPCSPTTASKPPAGDRWTHEVKWDGYRCQIIMVGRHVRLFSRNGADWTERMPAMAAAFSRLGVRNAQFDGELCLCDAEGRPDFKALMKAMRQSRVDEGRLSFHAFDLLHVNSTDLKPKPLSERHRRLVDLAQDQAETVPMLYLPDTFAGGADLLGICAKYRLEGIVSQRLDRPYVSCPTRDWIKVKCAAWKEVNRWRAEVFERSR